MNLENSIKNTDSISLEQIRLIKHTIGFDRRKVKRGKYIAWRNYYVADREMKDWESLVEWGMAVRYERMDSICYCVTDKGFDLLASILEIKIIKDDES